MVESMQISRIVYQINDVLNDAHEDDFSEMLDNRAVIVTAAKF